MWGTVLAWVVGLLMMFAAAINACEPGYGEPKGFTAGHLAWVVLGMGIILASYLARIARAAEATAEELRALGDPALEDPEPKADASRVSKVGQAAGRYMASVLDKAKGAAKKT